MHALLVKHDKPQESCVLRAIRAVESGDAHEIANSLNTLDFWGAAGSVIDLTLREIPWTAEFRRDIPDDNKLLLLELNLLEEMERLGFANPGVLARRSALEWKARHYGLAPP